MDNYVWYALQIKRNGKYYAYAVRKGMYENLASFVKDFEGLVAMNACRTKKYAMEVVQAWNNMFRENGIHLYDNNMPF